MALFEQISSDILAAMKAKDAVRRDTLRNVKKYFLEAKTAPGANDELTDDAALKILQKLAKQGRESAEIYQGQGRPDLAEEEMAQVRVIEEYLPKQLTEEELEAKLKEIIAEVGATGPRGTCYLRLCEEAFGVIRDTVCHRQQSLKIEKGIRIALVPFSCSHFFYL